MSPSKEALYRERLTRYVTALRNERPDKVPIRPFVAEFTAKYVGYTCQEATHDYQRAFEAARKCAAEFDWDAVVANMVYVWTGLTQAIGLTYYGVPGIDVPADTGFQYREPSEADAFMKADEYDALIDEPTGFLYNVWLPRVSSEISAVDAPTSYRNNLALVKGAMAMLSYFSAFGPQCEQLRTECGTVSAIAGIFKAPFDIIADKLRGYTGLTLDMASQPDKVLAACEALMPHLAQVALSTADPNHQVPIGFWMHRGCVPFVTPGQFESHYWTTLKPIIEELWRNGHQTLFYAEGNWDAHLDRFAELPERSIVYHVDRGDILKAHQNLGRKFCLSGGIANFLLSFGTPGQVRDRCRTVIDEVAQDGGYIMDASAIMQNDTSVENLQAMTDFARDYGVYDSGAVRVEEDDALQVVPSSAADFGPGYGMGRQAKTRVKPGACVPWEEKAAELPEIDGDAELVRRVWEEIDGMGNMFIWQCLLSF
ncbi:MAG: uroporphyrinogen decarboxylase family protein [Candidatus Latescibacteria bacterium]|nr:uroporphyrinogen decarboxylase family protein [Candidatus Latescibacterota bacterium]